MSTTVGHCCQDQEQTLYNKSLYTKNFPNLPVEYIWKLVAQLPPIPDVPPPQAKKAFSELLSLQSLQKAKECVSFFSTKKDGADNLNRS